MNAKHSDLKKLKSVHDKNEDRNEQLQAEYARIILEIERDEIFRHSNEIPTEEELRANLIQKVQDRYKARKDNTERLKKAVEDEIRDRKQLRNLYEKEIDLESNKIPMYKAEARNHNVEAFSLLLKTVSASTTYLVNHDCDVVEESKSNEEEDSLNISIENPDSVEDIDKID